MTTTANWMTVCQTSDLVDNSGVCALINEQQVALFKLSVREQVQLFAISNWDPIGKANVLYRGLLTSVGETITVASPLYKQRYSLATGQCLDADEIAVRVYPIRIEQQLVQIQIDK